LSDDDTDDAGIEQNVKYIMQIELFEKTESIHVGDIQIMGR